MRCERRGRTPVPREQRVIKASEARERDRDRFHRRVHGGDTRPKFRRLGGFDSQPNGRRAVQFIPAHARPARARALLQFLILFFRDLRFPRTMAGTLSTRSGKCDRLAISAVPEGHRERNTCGIVFSLSAGSL